MGRSSVAPAAIEPAHPLFSAENAGFHSFPYKVGGCVAQSGTGVVA
jgi:hypothetical protein